MQKATRSEKKQVIGENDKAVENCRQKRLCKLYRKCYNILSTVNVTKKWMQERRSVETRHTFVDRHRKEQSVETRHALDDRHKKEQSVETRHVGRQLTSPLKTDNRTQRRDVEVRYVNKEKDRGVDTRHLRSEFYSHMSR